MTVDSGDRKESFGVGFIKIAVTFTELAFSLQEPGVTVRSVNELFHT